MLPIRQTLTLSRGTVTLRAWPATVADAHLHDLLTLTATLGVIREAWHETRREDVTPEVWGAFWRLLDASLEAGQTRPGHLTWNDRLSILTALWELNDLEDAEGKLTALTRRAHHLVSRAQGQRTAPTTPRSMSS